MVSRSFEADARHVGAARDFVYSCLDGDPRTEDAGLIVSELATNAVRHAGSPFTVTIVLDGRLRIEVHDMCELLPVRKAAEPDAIDGHGLEVVEAVATTSGSRLVSGGGKVVWAELGRARGQRPRAPEVT